MYSARLEESALLALDMDDWTRSCCPRGGGCKRELYSVCKTGETEFEVAETRSVCRMHGELFLFSTVTRQPAEGFRIYA